MKRLILDHLRRWWWLWLIIGVGNCFTSGFSAGGKHGFDGFTFQLVLWLGAMQLNFDLQRGISRVHRTLPVTAKQIGWAWWVFSFALPALLLTATSALAMTVHAVQTHTNFPLRYFLQAATASSLMLGTLFFLFVGMLPVFPQTIAGWLRYIFSIGFLMLMIFRYPTFETADGLLIWLVALVMTVAAWFRAEAMVVRRTAFRPGVSQGKRLPGRSESPAGSGGLSFLCQTLLARLGYMAVTLAVWFVIMNVFMHGNFKQSPKQFLVATLPAFSSFGFFAILMFLLMPVILQVRHLRTLPISTTALAALLVLLPCTPVMIGGMLWTTLSGDGWQTPAAIWAYLAAISFSAPLLLWQGLRVGMFALTLIVMTVMITGTMLIHRITLPIHLVEALAAAIIILAFAITRRLLRNSSQAYRPLPQNLQNWGGWNGWGGGGR